MIEKLVNIQKNKQLAKLLNLLYPEHCIVCKRIGSWICSDCIQKTNSFSQLCFYCKEGSLGGRTHKQCLHKTAVSKLVSFYDYNDVSKKLLAELKFKHHYILSETILNMIKKRVNLFNIKKDSVISAIPLHPERERWRGYNQAELLARQINKILGITYIDIIKRSINTKPQSGMKFGDRKNNMKGAFNIINQPNPQIYKASELIMFDDVITSGSTMEEATQTVKKTFPKLSITAMCFAVARNQKNRSTTCRTTNQKNSKS